MTSIQICATGESVAVGVTSCDTFAARQAGPFDNTSAVGAGLYTLAGVEQKRFRACSRFAIRVASRGTRLARSTNLVAFLREVTDRAVAREYTSGCVHVKVGLITGFVKAAVARARRSADQRSDKLI